MTGPAFGFETFQNSFVVPDIKAALKHWVENMGVGPFYLYDHLDLGNITYRGKPADLDASLALAQSGGVQIELIEQHNDGPSAYRDLFGPGESGFHHVGVWVDDYDGAVAHYASLGYEAATTGGAPDIGGRFAYVDTSRDFGVMVELVERKQDVVDFQNMLIEAARNWDGSDPVRLVEL